MSKDPQLTPLTDPLADDAGLSLPPSDPVIALRVVGANVEVPLSPQKRVLTIGSAPTPDVDVSLSSRHVSRVHAAIHRRGNRLRIVDQESTNGIFLHDRREPAFEVAAGQSFRIADVKLLALDEHIRTLRTEAQWALGLGANAPVDDALETIATGAPLLLLGKPNCEQRALAEAIHRSSARRHRAFVPVAPPLATRPEQAAVLVHASRGTAFVDLEAIPTPSAFFVAHLFGPTYHIRPIIAATSYEQARELLGDERAQHLRTIGIPPLADRRADVPRLFDILFVRQGSRRTIAELGAARVAALMQYDWPRNFDDVRRHAPRLLALIEHGSVRAAARALNVAPQSLLEALGRIGLRDS
jgi:transcriptional regulator of acetoin/glycerol metabolism